MRNVIWGVIEMWVQSASRAHGSIEIQSRRRERHSHVPILREQRDGVVALDCAQIGRAEAVFTKALYNCTCCCEGIVGAEEHIRNWDKFDQSRERIGIEDLGGVVIKLLEFVNHAMRQLRRRFGSAGLVVPAKHDDQIGDHDDVEQQHD
jgi:hypothetical protein